MARKRRFSEEPFGPTVERLMNETGLTYRALGDKTKLSAGYLNHLTKGRKSTADSQASKVRSSRASTTL